MLGSKNFFGVRKKCPFWYRNKSIIKLDARKPLRANDFWRYAPQPQQPSANSSSRGLAFGKKDVKSGMRKGASPFSTNFFKNEPTFLKINPFY